MKTALNIDKTVYQSSSASASECPYIIKFTSQERNNLKVTEEEKVETAPGSAIITAVGTKFQNFTSLSNRT